MGMGMRRWSIVAFLLLLYLGCSVADGRRLIFHRRVFVIIVMLLITLCAGGPIEGHFARRVLNLGNRPKEMLRHLFGGELNPMFLRPYSLRSMKGVSQSFICNTCMDISTFAEQVLADPETTDNILEYINGSVCDSLPGLKEQCSSFAEMYVPEVVEMLQIYAAPDKLCGETKLCPSSSMLALDDAQTCNMCRNFANYALSYLKNNKTESEFLVALHLQCSKLGGLSARCDMLVNTYASLYMKELESMNPQEVCEKVGLCSPVLLQDSNHCAACEFAVYEIKVELQNPLVQEKMVQMLLEQCSKLSPHADECKLIVNQYGPLLIANLDRYVDADVICTKVHTCDHATLQAATDTVIQMPSIRQHEIANH